MNSRGYGILFGVIAVLALIGALVWWQTKGTDEAPESPGVDIPEPLPFSFEETTTTYHVSAELPKTDNQHLNNSVRRHADARIQEFESAYAPESIAPEEKQIFDAVPGLHYELTLTGTPWAYGTLSGMIVEEYTFTGGAHGGTSLSLFLYDAEGNDLRLRDLFENRGEYLTRVSEVVRPILKEELESGEIYVPDMFMTGTSPDEGNYMVFSVATTGITFYFQQYQVAPYVAGMPQVSVPLQMFENILSQKYF